MLRRLEPLGTYSMSFNVLRVMSFQRLLQSFYLTTILLRRLSFMVIVYLGYSTGVSEAPLVIRADGLKILQYETPRLLENMIPLQPIQPFYI